ncbi:MAG: hypothetical protein WCG27_01930 [Pseudomonadota bacterium]
MKKFLLINLLLTAYFTDYFPSWNLSTRALPVYTIIQDHTLYFDSYVTQTGDYALIKGHYYCEKAPLSTLITLIPTVIINLLIPLDSLGYSKSLNMIRAIGSTFCGTLPFLIILLLLANYLKQYVPEKRAYLLAMMLGYGSNTYIYSGGLWGHLLAAVFILGAYIQIKQKKKFMLAGLYAGLAVSAEYPMILFLGIISTMLVFPERRYRQCLQFILGSLPVLLLLGLYHYFITGSPFRPLYLYAAGEFTIMGQMLGMHLPSIKILAQLFAGPFRGLIWYTPILIYIIYLIARYRIFSRKFLLKDYLSPAIFVFPLYFSCYHFWWGGCCHGPRHLVPLVTLILYASIPLCLKWGKIKYLIMFSSVGILLNWVTKSVYYIYNDRFKFPFTQFIFPSFFSGLVDAPTIFSDLNISKYLLIYAWPVLFILAIVNYWDFSGKLRKSKG